MLMTITLHKRKQLAARKHEGKRMILNNLDTQFLNFFCAASQVHCPQVACCCLWVHQHVQVHSIPLFLLWFLVSHSLLVSVMFQYQLLPLYVCCFFSYSFPTPLQIMYHDAILPFQITMLSPGNRRLIVSDDAKLRGWRPSLTELSWYLKASHICSKELLILRYTTD